MWKQKTIFVVCTCLALTGCNTMWAGNPLRTNDIGVGIATPPAMDSSPVSQVVFTCENGASFTATFDDLENRASIERDGKTIVILPALETGSGYLYANDDFELRGQGDAAMWRVSNGVPTKCTAIS